VAGAAEAGTKAEAGVEAAPDTAVAAATKREGPPLLLQVVAEANVVAPCEKQETNVE
jgi:hypothetical protein